MLLGHLGVSVVLHHYGRADLMPVLLGGVCPDVVDKSLCQLLKLTISGRTYAHTLPALGVTTIGVGLLLGPATARAWFLGYAGHLLADSGGYVPWLFPFRRYVFTPSETDFESLLRRILKQTAPLEKLFLLWAAAILLGRLLRRSSDRH